MLSCDFLLERFVHAVLTEEGTMARQLMNEGLKAGKAWRELIGTVLWPASECLHQLRDAGLIEARRFNMAARTVGMLATQLAEAATKMSDARRLLVMAAPGERTEVGAHLMATLAEGYGFEVMFAGAHVGLEEMTFAVARLEPDVVVVQGCVTAARAGMERVMGHLKNAGVWPRVQVAAVGAAAVKLRGTACRVAADLVAGDPLEILELLALSPDYRAEESGAMEMLTGAGGSEATAVREFLWRRLGGRAQFN